jgi:hypothetical protein
MAYLFNSVYPNRASVSRDRGSVRMMDPVVSQRMNPSDQIVGNPDENDDINPIDTNPRVGDVFELKFEPDEPRYKQVQVQSISSGNNSDKKTIYVGNFDTTNPLNPSILSWTTKGLKLNRNNTKYLGNWEYTGTQISDRDPRTGNTYYYEPGEKNRSNTTGYGGKQTTKRRRLRRKKRSMRKRSSMRKRK